MYELRTPVFEHAPESGVFTSEWTNDCFDQGIENNCETVEDAIELADAVTFDDYMAGYDGGRGYVRVVDVETGETAAELVYEGSCRVQ